VSGFYKMDPAAWDFGTADLSLEEEAAYLRIVNAIHKHDGPVPNNDRVLAGLFRSSTRKARALLDALVAAGKVVIEDGKIWNERARSDLVQRQLTSGSAAVRGSKGGRKRAEMAAKSLEDNDAPQANASSRIEENRIEKREAKASPQKGRGSRIADDWVLPMAWGQWAVSEGLPPEIVRAEADKFKDYWTAKSGRDAAKADWQATWRNWVRMALERQPKSFGGHNGNGSHKSATDNPTLRAIARAASAFEASPVDWPARRSLA
jgi:uncharacterized protein YdaU (DUF1376 family)